MKFDVLIIGGGPAGTLCGTQLQRAGLHTCIIERSHFPREKLCGGLLTQKTIDLLHAQLPDLPQSAFVVNRADTVAMYFQKDKAMTMQTDGCYRFTNRIIFDSALMQQYQKAGGTLVEGVRVSSRNIRFQANEVEADGQTFQYEVLVGADGCNSVVTRAADICRHDYFCLEGEYTPAQFKADDFRIYFGYPENAYAWYFPKNGYYTVGLGGINRDKGLKRTAQHFFAKVADTTDKVRGAFIPSGRKMCLDKLPANVLAIGDAGGFIDPITGEGIYYALLTGTLAAEAVVAQRETDGTNLHKIFQKKTAAIRQNIRHALRWHSFLYNPHVLAWFIRSIEKHQNFARFYLEHVISTYEYTYRNFVWVYLRKFRKK